MPSPFPFHGIFSSLGDDDSAAAEGSTIKRQPTPEPVSFEGRQPAQQKMGQVAVDIFELDGYYVIKAPIAGIHLNDIDIEISENTITIRGERKQSDPVPQGNYFLQECFWGSFSRKVELPITIDPRKVKATFNKESILRIVVPKEQEKVKIVRISDA